jgi:hypothetical protein
MDKHIEQLNEMEMYNEAWLREAVVVFRIVDGVTWWFPNGYWSRN